LRVFSFYFRVSQEAKENIFAHEDDEDDVGEGEEEGDEDDERANVDEGASEGSEESSAEEEGEEEEEEGASGKLSAAEDAGGGAMLEGENGPSFVAEPPLEEAPATQQERALLVNSKCEAPEAVVPPAPPAAIAASKQRLEASGLLSKALQQPGIMAAFFNKPIKAS